jgi:hypothetical protein
VHQHRWALNGRTIGALPDVGTIIPSRGAPFVVLGPYDKKQENMTGGPRMPRKRRYTEMIGCCVSKAEYEVLKTEMKRQRLTVADYLRQTAIRPLLETPKESDNGPQAA